MVAQYRKNHANSVTAPITNRSLAERKVDWPQRMPWPEEYGKEIHRGSALTDVQQVLDGGRQRRTRILKPQA